MGLFGSWKFNGLHSLGVITLNTDCIPQDGVFVEPKKEEEKVRIVEVIKEVKGDTVEVPVEVEVENEKVDPIPLIVLALVFFITVACILFYCLHCIRRHKKRIEVLESEKKETPPVWNDKGKRRKLVQVGDGVPDYAIHSDASNNSINIKIHEESARVPLHNIETQELD